MKTALVLAALLAVALLVMPRDSSKPRAATLPVASAAAVAAPATIGDLIPAPITTDASGDARDGIDLTGVSFKQRGTEIEFKVTTTAAVKLEDLVDPARSLCVQLFKKGVNVPEASVCLGGTEDAAFVRYTTLAADGKPLVSSLIPVGLDRPDKTTIVTNIRPTSIGLTERDFSWQAVTSVTGTDCPEDNPCVDRTPNTTPVASATRLVVAPPCFGAQSRPESGSCGNGALRLMVVPTPDDALFQANSYCRELDHGAVINPCQFGVESGKVAATVALIGDSHAAHWRSALNSLALDERWVGLSITRSGCRYSTSPPTHPNPKERKDCLQFRRALVRWLQAHPKIHTVFLSNHIGGFAGPHAPERAVRQAVEAMNNLPKSVKHLYVIRDVPMNGVSTADCVTAAIRKKKAAGPACAVPRNRALSADPTVVAARRVKRAHVIDLTSRFCSKRFCLPVIGGALVHKDVGHITDVFSTSLGQALIKRYKVVSR